MKPVVYISGPISSPVFTDALANLHWFFVMEIQLKRSGYSVINPAADLIACIMAGDFEFKELLENDEALVKKADALFLHLDWQDSRGATMEHDWAVEDGIPIAHAINDLHEIFDDDWVGSLRFAPDD